MISHCCIFGYPICGQINIPKCHLGLFSYDSWDVGKRVWPKRPTPLQEHTALQTKWKNVEAGTDWIIQTYGVFLKMVDLQNYGLHMVSLLKWCNMCNFGWADSSIYWSSLWFSWGLSTQAPSQVQSREFLDLQYTPCLRERQEHQRGKDRGIVLGKKPGAIRGQFI